MDGLWCWMCVLGWVGGMVDEWLIVERVVR